MAQASLTFGAIPRRDWLLRTKLHIPPPRPDLVTRPRLTARLDEGLSAGCKLTLISAPVGFGKTTLLSEWISRLKSFDLAQDRSQIPRPRFAWFSLDERDNDLGRFLTYVVAALDRLQSDSAEEVLPAVNLSQVTSEDVLTTLINRIATDIPHDCVLVLDDYHVITAQAVHDALVFLLDHLPPQMHMVIATRMDPPLPLAQLRARGQLVELRASDLRFTADEAAALLNQVMRLNLSSDDVTALDARTEGWIAGLQLAALSMRDRENVPGFIEAFAGTHRYIVDYLAEQVLLRQPPGIQSFLLQTSILDRLTSPLCDAVTGQTDGQAMLEQLEAANLFIVPLDDERRWYRYHHLFADVLRNRLGTTQPDRVPILHRRASEWCEREGLVTEAFHHALAAEDIVEATRLVEENARFMIKQGELTTVLEWLAALPDKVVCSRPRLCVDYAWALFLTGQTSAVEPRLQDAEQSLAQRPASHPAADEERKITSLLGEVTLIRLLLTRFQDDPARTIELCQRALEQIDTGNLFARGLLYLNLGIAFRRNRQVASATQAFLEAIALGQAAGNPTAAMISAFNLIKLYQVQGQLGRAAETCRQMLHSVQERSRSILRRSPALGMICLGMADVLYEWDDLEAAEQHLRDGIALGVPGGYVGMMLNGYTLLARLRQARGDVRGALDAIRQAEQAVQRVNPPRTTLDEVAAYRAWLHLTQGDLEAAARWAQTLEPSSNIGLDTLGEFKLITLTRVLLAQGNRDEARSLLGRLLQAAETDGRIGKTIELLALQALMRQADGDGVGALEDLKNAMMLAEPEGYVRTFVDEGAPMAELLLWGIECNTWTKPSLAAYVSKLLSHFGLQPPAQSKIQDPKSKIAEPLSERELQVLQLVAEGSSNQAIAQELSVTVSTVKAHLRNINGKLGVSSRTQAVARARALRLLP